MKITFVRNVDCDLYNCRTGETSVKYYQKWDSLLAEAVEKDGPAVNIALYDGNTIMSCPRAAIEISN